MPVNIIDTLKPKNGLSFPVVEAIDVFVEGFDSLADCVAHMATTAMIEAINAALSGKQDELTTVQLTAVNSGITSELVTQIGTNTTAIAGKADAADLTAAATSLQAQIDAIITPVTEDAEVQNARIDTNNKTWPTLKARLDADDTQITGNLAEFEDYIYSDNLVAKKFTKRNYGHYTVTAEGGILSNANYDSYIYAINPAIYSKVKITGTAAVCGWFSGLPLDVRTTIDEVRHTNYSDSEVDVLSGTVYLFVNVLTGSPAPIITVPGESVIDIMSEEIAAVNDDNHRLIGSTAPLPADEWEIGNFVISNNQIEYKTRTYDIRTKQDTTKHFEKGMKITVENVNDRFSLLIAIKKGTSYTLKTVNTTSYVFEETGDYVITVQDSSQETLSNVSTILDHISIYYSGIFEEATEEAVNLFDYETTVYEYYIGDEGAEVEMARWYHSDYIDVEEGKKYAIKCTSSVLGAFYNGTTYVDTIKRSAYSQPGRFYSVFTVPEGVTKVRVNGYREEGNGSPSVTVRPEAYMMVEGVVMPDNYISHNVKAEPQIKIKDSILSDYILTSNVLYGKKLLTFGDSITDGRNHQYVFDSESGYILNYAGYVAKRNGMKYYNKGWSGGTLSYGQKSLVPSSGDSFNILLDDIDTPDIITIMYGFNDSNNSEHHELGDIDSTDRTTFCGAWNFTIPKLRELYPNARIGIIIMYGMKSGWEEMTIRIANKFGIPYWNMNDGQTYCIRGNGTSDLDPDVATELTEKYTYDGTHPNDAGYALISTQFEAFLRRI